MGDQATKFVFWRSVADRVSYLRPASLIWVTEVWLRRRTGKYSVPVHNLPIQGEMLQVIGLDRDGTVRAVHFNIKRESPDVKPTVERSEAVQFDASKPPNFLLAVATAFRRKNAVTPTGSAG